MAQDRTTEQQENMADEVEEPILQRTNAIRRKGGYSWKKEAARRRMFAHVLSKNIITKQQYGDLITLDYAGIRCQSCYEKITGSSLELSPALLSIYDQYTLKDQNANKRDGTTKAADSDDNATVETRSVTPGNIYQDGTNLTNDNCDKTTSPTEPIYADMSNKSDTHIRNSFLTDNQKRPLSISSVSSTSSSSLPNTFICKQQNGGDFDTSSSGPETGSRSSYGMVTDGSSSNMSVDTTASVEDNDTPNRNNDAETPLYDNVYDESSHFSDANIYENLPADSGNLTDTNDEEVYSNYADYRSNERLHSFSAKNESDTTDTPTYTRKLTLKSGSKKQRSPRSPRSRLFNSPISSSNDLCEGQYVTYAQRVAAELVETEQAYMKSLQEIILGYMHDLNHAVGVTVTEQDKDHLFGNLIDIYQFSRELLKELVECRDDPVRVAQCFVNHSQGFSIYASYCTNYPRSMEVLTKFMSDRKIAEVFRVTQACLGHGLALGAYLLKPVQRILKYHLLFQNIVKNFDSQSEGYVVLKQALQTMTSLAKDINEMKRKHEHAVRIQEVGSQLDDYVGPDLTTLGELILEGSFRMYGAKASRQAFLFERAILVTKKKEANMMSCKAFIMCHNLMLVESVPKEPQSFHIIPFNNPKLQCTLVARNIDMKRRWCQEIKKLILASYSDKIPEKAKSLVMELGRSLDDHSVGVSDFVDNSSGYKQHTAPGYLEKRIKGRRKSGTFIDFTLLRNRKGNNKKGHETDWKDQPPLTATSNSSTPKPTNFNDDNLEEFLAMVGSKSMDDISRMQADLKKYGSLPKTISKSPNSVKRTSQTLSFQFGRLASPDDKTKSLGRNGKPRNNSFHRLSRRDSGKAASDVELYESSESDCSESESETEGNYVNVVYSRKSSQGSNDEGEKKVTMPENEVEDETDRDSGYVTMVLQSDGDACNGHKPLKRMSYAKSTGSLTKNDKDHANSLITKHGASVERLAPSEDVTSPTRSNSSSYENLSFKCQQTCGNKPDVLPKPVGWKNGGMKIGKHSHSQSCLSSGELTNWSGNEVTIYEEYPANDPWVRNSTMNSADDEPTHPALRKISESRLYKNQYCPVNRSTSFPNADRNHNFDWIVYKSKLAGSKSYNLDKLLKSESMSAFDRINYSGKRRDDTENATKKLAAKFESPPITLPEIDNGIVNSPNRASVKSLQSVAKTPFSPNLSPIHRQSSNSSGSPSFTRKSKHEASDISIYDPADSDKLVEEMENYAKTSENSRRSSLPKFPTSPYLSYAKSKKYSSVSLKEQNSLASSRESLKSIESTGSSSTVLSTFSAESSLTLSGQRRNSTDLAGEVRSQLQSLTTRLAAKPVPGENKDDVSTTSEPSHDHRYKCGRVNKLARKYSSQDKQIQSLIDARSKSGSCLETMNSDVDDSLAQKSRTQSCPGNLSQKLSFSEISQEAESIGKRLYYHPESNAEENCHQSCDRFSSESQTGLMEIKTDNDDEKLHADTIYENNNTIDKYLEADCVYNEIEFAQEEYKDRRKCDDSQEGQYEKRMSAVLDTSDVQAADDDDEVFSDNNQDTDDHSGQSPPETRPKPRVSIKKFVQILEENNRPRPTFMMDVKKRAPSGTIQERLRHLQQSSQYQHQQRAVQLNNGDGPPKSVRHRKAELFLSSRNSPERPVSYNHVVDNSANSFMKTAHSMGKLDQISDTTTLETMKGWVQQLISKFQAEN